MTLENQQAQALVNSAQRIANLLTEREKFKQLRKQQQADTDRFHSLGDFTPPNP